jgi:hypothetical protein
MRRLLAVLVLAGCTGKQTVPADPALWIGAPTEERTAFEVAVNAYGRDTGMKAHIMFASPSEMVASGVRLDVVAVREGEGLQAWGPGNYVEARSYARDPVVLIGPRAQPLTFAALGTSERIVVVDPRGPSLTGRVTEAMWGRLRVRADLKSRLDYVSTVPQLLERVRGGAIGVALASDVATAKDIVVLDRSENPSGHQVAIAVGSPHTAEARRFLDVVIGAETQASLAVYGLAPPSPAR